MGTSLNLKQSPSLDQKAAGDTSSEQKNSSIKDKYILPHPDGLFSLPATLQVLLYVL